VLIFAEKFPLLCANATLPMPNRIAKPKTMLTINVFFILFSPYCISFEPPNHFMNRLRLLVSVFLLHFLPQKISCAFITSFLLQQPTFFTTPFRKIKLS